MIGKTKFTPGPWRIKRDAYDRHLRAGNGSSLMCDTSYYPWTPSSDADWNLIAAAPEMYEALDNLENDDGSVPATAVEDGAGRIKESEGRGI